MQRFQTIVLSLVILGLLVAAPAQATRVHVDDSATGAADGSTKADAYTTIQAGVTAAADADSIWVWPGTYVESIAIGSSDDNFTIHGVPDSTITVTPSGTTQTTNGNCFQVVSGTNLTIKNIQMLGTGTSGHYGIVYHVASPLVVEDCTFTNLRSGINNYSGIGTDLTVTDCTFTSPQIANPQNGTVFVYGYDADLTITGSSFDMSGVVGEQWFRGVGISGSSSTTIQTSAFVSDEDDQQPLFQSIGSNSNILIEKCSFEGGTESAGEAAVQFGAGVAGQKDTGVVVRFNTFTKVGTRGLFVSKNAADNGGELHNDFSIYGNTFISGSAGTASGTTLVGVNGGMVVGNKFFGFNGANGSALSLASTRSLTVSGNTFNDNDNGVVIVASSALTDVNQYGCSIVGNYFVNGAADGAIKIDNYDGAAGYSNDSLLTVAGNVFVNVTAVAKWVNTSDVTSTFTTLADYQNTSTGWPSKSTIDRGNTVGSSDGSEGFNLFRAAGILPPVVSWGSGGYRGN